MKAKRIVGLILLALGLIVAFSGIFVAAIRQKLWIFIVFFALGIILADVGTYLHRYARRQKKMKERSGILAEEIRANMEKAREMEKKSD